MPKETTDHKLRYPEAGDSDTLALYWQHLAEDTERELNALEAATQTARVSTGILTVGASEVVKLTWPEAFADTNYTIAISVRRAIGSSPVPPAVQTLNKKAASVEVGVTNQASEGEQYVVEAIAIHD